MPITIYTQATISEKFKRIIQSGNYEKLIYDLLNTSTELFPNGFEYIEQQAHGECDFIDKANGQKYDAKLPITSEQGKMIGSRNGDYEKWIQSMLDECTEFKLKVVCKFGTDYAKKMKLYQTMSKLINDDQDDENIIFFFPFPVVCETSNSIYGQFAMDILSFIYDGLRTNRIIEKQEVYAVYPSADNKIIIRNLRTKVRESFSAEILNEYIKYDIQITKENYYGTN